MSVDKRARALEAWGPCPMLEVATTALCNYCNNCSLTCTWSPSPGIVPWGPRHVHGICNNTNLVHATSGIWGHAPGARVSDHGLTVIPNQLSSSSSQLS